MSYLYPFNKSIQLHVQGRVSAEDAERQELTAREILKRLSKQPGVILADEVGMGKTFVALAVAVSVELSNRHRRPVVVMVPPSLKEKWPTDFDLFREKCLPAELAEKVMPGRAETAVDFLKLLDDPPEKKKSIIFATHGAMSRGLTDHWVKLALIYQTLRKRWGTDSLRKRLSRILPKLLWMSGKTRDYDEETWRTLLATHPSQWLSVAQSRGLDMDGDGRPETDDDPVPKAVWEVLGTLPTDGIYEHLMDIPQRSSKYMDERIAKVRDGLSEDLKEVWGRCIRSLRVKLPLLILDEAHHLKNPDTRLSRLFAGKEAQADADELSSGPLNSVFERMLFMTATPFQLGHAELCSVLDRFGSISWKTRLSPPCGKEGFIARTKDLHEALDAAQDAVVSLDSAWGRLTPEDLEVPGKEHENIEEWWAQVQAQAVITGELSAVGERCRTARTRMKEAERLLRPWVIRHLKPRHLPKPNEGVVRRERLVGRAICDDVTSSCSGGISVSEGTLLPFLLAARASYCAPDSRPVFAEGLASSYEAFLETRRMTREKAGSSPRQAIDSDDDATDAVVPSDASRWYLDRLELLVPRGDRTASASHPKIHATVSRVLDVWRAGEKALVFCHFIATGRVLRQLVSSTLQQEIRTVAAAKLGSDLKEVDRVLERIGDRFFRPASPVSRACEREIDRLLRGYPSLLEHREALLDVVQRNVRTPSFLVRFFPLRRGRLTEDDMVEAMQKKDMAGITLAATLERFFCFLVERCGVNERRRYLEAIQATQTGSHKTSDIAATFTDDELQGDSIEMLIPNVRLVNGTTRSETRQKLMLTFNTPFFPEILIASSVMAEGVDLQLNCRHVIHHDLCWNPSTLEQRTGRVDRIGAKAEYSGQPIRVYLPFVAETQDEKMYQVVMDRERWFSVVMGEKYQVDTRTTDRIAARIPLPDSIARDLAFRLEVVPGITATGPN